MSSSEIFARRVEQLAVHVELGLVPRAVADAHRPAVAVTGQRVELVLRDEALAADAVHDLQALPAREAAGGGVGEEVEEPARLEAAPARRERADREAGVAHPRVAVVPVADAADLLGQRRRRRRDDRAGRRVVERPQHDRAAPQEVAVLALVADELLGPRLPTGDRGVSRAATISSGLERRAAVAPRVAGLRARTRRARPRRASASAAQHRAVELERARRVETTTAIGPPRVRHVPSARRDARAASSARTRDGPRSRRRARRALRCTRRCARSPDGECRPMSLWRSSACSGMKSVSRDRAGRGAERGLEHHRVLDVLARWPRPAPRGRIDQKPPGSPRMRAKKAGESRLRQAGPVDRPGAADERAALAVAEQRVVRDRRGRRRRSSPTAHGASSWPDRPRPGAHGRRPESR